MPAIRIDVYSRPGCHLCDEAKEVIDRVRSRHLFDLNVINIALDPSLEAMYGAEIPVVLINGNKAFKYRVEMKEFLKKLAARV